MDLGYSSEDDIQETTTNPTITSLPTTNPVIPEFTVYLKNFSYQKGMNTCFISIPWKPSFSIVKQLSNVTHKALQHLQHRHPQFHRSHEWQVIGEEIPRHISLTGSFEAFPSQIEEFHHSFSNAILFLRIDQELIAINTERVQKNLSLNKAYRVDMLKQTQNCIRLKFEPNICIFKNVTSGNLFMASTIRLTKPTTDFFEGLKDLIQENCILTDITPKFVDEQYHISLLKSFDIDEMCDLEIINESLKDEDFSILEDIAVDVEELTFDFIGKTKGLINFKFF